MNLMKIRLELGRTDVRHFRRGDVAKTGHLSRVRRGWRLEYGQGSDAS